MPRPIRKALSLVTPVLAALLLSGCFLRSMFGTVIFVENIADEVNEIITTVFSDSTAAVCIATDFGFYECTYIIGGEIITSSLYLLSELGLAGVLVDPVVVQVPDDAFVLEATFDDGSGAQDLIVRALTSFEAQPGMPVNAEAGHKFFILDFPSSVTSGLPSGDPTNGEAFDITFSYQRNRPIAEPVTAQSVKVMFTGKVIINNHVYYPPLLPCTTDFATIPALEVPLSQNQVDLLPSIEAALQQNPPTPCDHQGYYYDGAPPPHPPSIYLPLVVH